MQASTSTLTLDRLMARVYRHIPRGISFEDPRHRTSEESRRLACVLEAAAIACGKGIVPVPDDDRVAVDPEVLQVVDALRAWRRFGERCEQAFPDREVWDESGPFFDPGYRYSVAQAGYIHPPTVPVPGTQAPPAKAPPSGQRSPEKRDPVLCVVSVLAPVYAIVTHVDVPRPYAAVRYDDFPGRYHDRVGKLSALARQVFGFCRLGEDILRTPTPDLQPHTSNRPMNEMTLGDCLFTPFY